jgi:hypothetical protein
MPCLEGALHPVDLPSQCSKFAARLQLPPALLLLVLLLHNSGSQHIGPSVVKPCHEQVPQTYTHQDLWNLQLKHHDNKLAVEW